MTNLCDEKKVRELADEWAEQFTCQIQTLLTDKYTNSFLIAHGVIGQKLEPLLSAALAACAREALEQAAHFVQDRADYRKSGGQTELAMHYSDLAAGIRALDQAAGGKREG